MGAETKEITAKIKIDAIIEEAQKELATLGSSFDKVWKHSKVPKNLAKEYESLKLRLASLQEISQKGTINSSDLSRADSDYKAFQKTLHNMSVEFKLFSTEQKKALLGTEELANIKARKEAIKDYSKALEKNQEILKKRGPLEEQKKTLSSKKTSLNTSLDEQKDKLSKLKSGGPTLGQKATQYVNNTKETERIQKLITTAENSIAKALASGAKRDSTKIQSINAELEELKKQLEQIDTTTGKSDFDEAIQTHKNSVRELEQSIKDTKEAISTNNSELQDTEKQLKALKVTDSKTALEDLKETLKNLGVEGIDSAEDVTTLKRAVQKLETEALKNIDKEFNAMIAQLKSLEGAADQAKNGIDGASASIKKSQEAIENEQAFEARIKSFLGLAGATQMLRSALRDAISTITKLDAAMTEMAVVTDLSVGDYWDQLPQYSQRANELGVSITSVYEASTLYYQQGLKTNEVTELSTETLKMAKIAGLDAAEATDRMTAALRGFNLELNELNASKVADVYSELAAITASDVDEISTAMTKTASIAASAGMEFETTAAFLSQIIETTRESAETAGTAMKTVIARFQELKKAPDEIGEIDGEIVDANAIESALRSVGVSLRDSSGQFRELDEVFLELSGKWDSLDKNTQRYIATIAAGSRQQSRFIAMMSDYGRTQELVTAANNSAGASNDQFAKTLDSLESKVEKLKSAWHQFAMGIMDSDLVKFGVDALTKLLEIINKATEGIGNFGGGLSKVMSILTLFKMGQKVFDKFKTPVMNMFGSIVEMAGISGEKSARAFLAGMEKVKNEQAGANAGTGTPTTATPGSSQPTFAETGVSQRKGLRGWAENTGAKLIGGDHLADAARFAKEAHEGKQLIKGKTREGLVENQQTAQNNLTQAQSTMSTLQSNKMKQVKQVGSTKKNLEALEAKGVKKGTKEWKKANDAYKAAQGSLKKVNAEINDQQKNIDDATTALENSNTELNDYDTTTEQIKESSKNAWSSVSDGISTMSTALTGGGMAVSALGEAFIAVGADEFGEGLQKAGSIMTTLGSIMGFVNPLIALLQPLFTGAGTAGVASGTASTAAWSVVGIIVMIVLAAILVAIAAVLIVMAILKNTSPEEKLKQTQEAANRAAEAADRAAEAYDNLKNSLDGLEDKYKALEGLTEGTQEWNDAVQDINDSVLNLIDEYPELASLVQTDANGVLRLDTESAEVQAIMNEKKQAALTAKNNANMAKVEVKQAEAELAYHRLDSDAKVGTKSDTNNLARALASGAIAKGENGFKVLGQNKLDEMGIDFSQSELDSFYAVVGDNVDQLIEYGEQLEATTAQEEAMFQAMATQVTSMTDTTGWTDLQKEQLTNMLDSDTMSTFYKDEMSDLEGKNFTDKEEDDEERRLKEDAVKATYGENARYENGKVFYTDENEKEVEADLSNDEWKRMIASNETTKRATAAAEALPDAINKSIDMTTKGMSEEDREKTAAVMNKAMADKSGKNLTKAEMTQLRNTEQMSELQFMSLSQAEKDALGGSYVNYIKNITEAQEAAEKGWADLSNEMSAYGVDFQGITLGAAEGLMDNFEKVASISGKASADAVASMTQSILQTAGDKQEEVAARINATDWTSVESLNDLQYDLIHTYGLSEDTAKNYTNSLKEASFATSKFAYTIDALGEFYVASQKLEQALKKASEAEWKYQKALDGHGAVTNDMIKEMAEAQLDAFSASKEMREAAELDVLRAYGEGSTFSDKHGNSFASQWSLDENNQLVNKDGMSMLEYKQNHLNEEQAEEFGAWVENISEQVDKIQESEDAQKEAIDALYDLQAQSEESYYELRDMIKEALDADIQEFIDLQQEEIDATKETADAIANKIQQQIDEERQNRQNQDQLKAIADAQEKLAYLKMDTSGMNDLDILSLQKEIDTMEQEYTDNLIDQKLDEFIDANQLAYDQREEQIRLLQAQASSFTQSEVYQQQINQKLDDALNGNQGVLSWLAEYHTKGMSQQEKEDWEHELDNTTTLANYFTKGVYKDKQGNVFSGSTQAVYYKKENGKLSYITSQDFNKLDQATKDTYSSGTATISTDSDGNHSMTITGADGTEIASGIDLTGGSFESIADSMVSELNAQSANDARRTSLIQKGYDAKFVQGANETELARMEAAYANLVSYQNPNADISLSATKVAGFLGANTKNIMDDTEGRVKDRHAAEALNIWEYGDMADILATNSGYVPATITHEWPDSWGNYIVQATVAGETDNYVQLSKNTVERHANLLNQLYTRTGGGQITNGSTLILHDELLDVFGTNGLVTYWNGGWHSVVSEFENNKETGTKVQYTGLRGGDGWKEGPYIPAKLHNAARDYRKITGSAYEKSRFAYGYKTGGLADFTGPAWLDGTPSKPEYVLNAAQTERFFSLIDVLESFNKNSNSGSTSGDTTIDIDINVEKISDDYDVEKLANKIRSMLYQDATYRNVNNISHTR